MSEILAQGFEIQWKVSQAMQRLKQVNLYLVLANETGQLSSDMARQIIILIAYKNNLGGNVILTFHDMEADQGNA